ncbi:MAG: hypothetical protein RL336_1532 [Pseudomonadota bacterium]|jgi:hypothetical protein
MSVEAWMKNHYQILVELAKYRSRSDVSMANYSLYQAALRTGLLDQHFNARRSAG